MTLKTRIRLSVNEVYRFVRSVFDARYRRMYREYRAAAFLAERGFIIIPVEEIKRLMANADDLTAAIEACQLPDNRHRRQVAYRAGQLHETAHKILKIMEQVIVFGGGTVRW